MSASFAIFQIQSSLFGVSHFPFQKHSCHRAPGKLKVCLSRQQTGTDTLQQLIAGTALSLEKRYRSRTQTHRRRKVLRPTGVTSLSAFAVCSATLFPFGKTAAVVCLNTYYMSGITRTAWVEAFFSLPPPPIVQFTLMKREYTKNNQGFKS